MDSFPLEDDCVDCLKNGHFFCYSSPSSYSSLISTPLFLSIFYCLFFYYYYFSSKIYVATQPIANSVELLIVQVDSLPFLSNSFFVSLLSLSLSLSLSLLSLSLSIFFLLILFLFDFVVLYPVCTASVLLFSTALLKEMVLAARRQILLVLLRLLLVMIVVVVVATLSRGWVLLFVVCCLLFIVCCLLFVVCCLLFVLLCGLV